MSVKEKHKRSTRAHAQPMKHHSEHAGERGHREAKEHDESPRNRLAKHADEVEELPRSKRRHSEDLEDIAVPRSAPEPVKETVAEQDEDSMEPSAEELQAEEATVQAAAGMVPRDEEATAPVKERGGYDADTAIKLYLRE